MGKNKVKYLFRLHTEKWANKYLFKQIFKTVIT